MRHLVRDVSRVLTLFLASRQAWPKILGGGVSMSGGETSPPKGAWIKHCTENIAFFFVHIFSWSHVLLTLIHLQSYIQSKYTKFYFKSHLT